MSGLHYNLRGSHWLWSSPHLSLPSVTHTYLHLHSHGAVAVAVDPLLGDPLQALKRGNPAVWDVLALGTRRLPTFTESERLTAATRSNGDDGSSSSSSSSGRRASAKVQWGLDILDSGLDTFPPRYVYMKIFHNLCVCVCVCVCVCPSLLLTHFHQRCTAAAMQPGNPFRTDPTIPPTPVQEWTCMWWTVASTRCTQNSWGVV